MDAVGSGEAAAQDAANLITVKAQESMEREEGVRMQSMDFFTLTGLSFDPPEQAPDKISNAIDDALAAAAEADRASDAPGSTEHMRKQAFLTSVRKRIFDPQGNLTAAYFALAEKARAAAGLAAPESEEATVPVHIDRERSRFQGRKLIIKLCEPLPPAVTGFLYAVRTKTRETDQAPWLEKAKAVVGEHGVRKILATDYNRLGEIVYSETNDIANAYYVSVFSEYQANGVTRLSEPETIKLVRPQHVTVQYSLAYAWFRRTPLLHVTFVARRLAHLPRMILCCGKGDLYIRSHDDPDAITIMEIKEEYLRAIVDFAERTYPLPSQILKGTKVSLFIPDTLGPERYRVLPTL